MFSLDFKNLIKTKNLNIRPSQPNSQDRPLFRITKPILLNTNKNPVVTKRKPEEKSIEKNSILLEYKQYIDSLEKSSNYNFKSDVLDFSSSSSFLMSLCFKKKINLAVTKNNFTFHYVIGKGGFGKVINYKKRHMNTYLIFIKVWRVETKKSRTPYAMKEMSKSKLDF